MWRQNFNRLKKSGISKDGIPVNEVMQNRNSGTHDPDFQKEVRIGCFGRLGNYFFAEGCLSGFGDQAIRLQYDFKEAKGPVGAEFSFLQTHREVPATCGNVNRKGFLDLFWINDGYKLKVDLENPAIVSWSDETAGRESCRIALHELQHNDFSSFLAVLGSMRTTAVWLNRVVLEIVHLQERVDKLRFLRKSAESAGLETMETAFRQVFSGVSETDAIPLILEVCSHWIAGLDANHLPHDLKSRFLDLIGILDITRIDSGLLQLITRQLTRVDHQRACRFSQAVIASREFDRIELANHLLHCFPRGSQWWIQHALKNPELGAEQAADALNVAATAAATQGQTDLALLSYQAALKLDPHSQSTAWNLGCLQADQGEIAHAEKTFASITRHYAHGSLSTLWPRIQEMPWPAAAQDNSQFTLPAGASAWPRITVITPSFNQGGFIEETVLSILNQGYPNLQYIIVDGASSDETSKVLDRYRSRIDHLIVEKDNGQSEAINKGLRLADGDIVTWLNSDDMQAPGTLHFAALTWLRNQADVIAGICIEHEDHRIRLLNKPAARNIDFNPPQLARIFKYWFKGFYFYQPEAFFSRSILNKVGLLDESLFYTMDYDLWMRFAKAGAVLEVVDWPFAFFRKHDSQKTANFADCIEEQARVRNLHHELIPGDERHHQIQRALDQLHRRKNRTIGILSIGSALQFSSSIQAELDQFCTAGFACHLSDNGNDPLIAAADMIILLVHASDELAIIKELRASKPDRLICGWFWNNHQRQFENHAIAEAVDIVIPGHTSYGEYLRNDQSRHAGHLPLCVTQWARQDVVTWFDVVANKSRSQALFGSFVDSPHESAHDAFLLQLMEKLPDHALSHMTPAQYRISMERVEKDRFTDWCGYHTSLILPRHNELPQQLFNALLAGQIPLVPEEITDLDLLIPKDLQNSLPVIRFSLRDPASCIAAYRKSCGHAETEGNNGARRRHEYVLSNGLFSSRIHEILKRFIPDCESSS